jgi:Domain of unknown function (DUF3850)
MGDKRLPIRHTLKSWPPYFADTWVGVKTFDVRRDDRDYQIGDEVQFIEWEHGGSCATLSGVGRETGRKLLRRIVYILGRESRGSADAHSFGIEPGFVVLGLAP